MLMVTSLIGSLIGFTVCYRTLAKLSTLPESQRMRVCMMNSMALAFIFAMFVELTTNSKVAAILVPFLSVCIPVMWTTLNQLEVIELGVTSLMSVSMSVMLLGMVDVHVVWVIQLCLVAIEGALFLVAPRHNAHPEIPLQ